MTLGLDREVRRLLDDPREFMRRTPIRDSSNRINPMGDPWPEQEAWINAILGPKKYVLAVKPRQVGFTTCVSNFFFWNALTSAYPWLGISVGHERNAVRRLRDMLETAHDGMPEELQGGYSTRNLAETRFKHNGAGVDRMVAGAKGQAKGWTYNAIHATEMAFWPTATAAAAEGDEGDAQSQVWSSANATVHDQYAKVIVESTGNGPAGLFYELCQEAQESDAWEFVFTPWQSIPRYREPLTVAPDEFERSLDDYERTELLGEWGLSFEQINFRRVKIRTERWTKMQFRRFYPLGPMEPFIYSENGWFDSDALSRMTRWLQPLSYAKDELRIFRKKEPGRLYFGGGDTSKGVKRDWAVFHVIDDLGRHCATWASNSRSPKEQGRKISQVGGMYDRPLSVIEANTYGEEVIREAQRLGGVRLWKDDSGRDFYSEGGRSGDSKRRALTEARELIDEGGTAVMCHRTIQELVNVIEKRDGRIEGRGEGKWQKKDDFAMAYVMALWALASKIPRLRKPKKEPTVSDNHERIRQRYGG